MKIRLTKTTAIPLIILLILCVVCIGKVVYAEDLQNTVTATINYYYYDETAEDYKGTRPYPAFVANMPKGSSSITEKSPVLVGYTPSLSTVTVSFDQDSTVDVFYNPSNVAYVIRLNTQNVNDDGYTVSEIINGEGLTGTEPKEFQDDELETKYDGFTLMYHVPDVIASDGSTEFEFYYDRNYYLIDVDLGNGGYGVEPIYARYGSSFSIGTPKRTGFSFKGWTVTQKDTGELLSEVPSTVPSHDILLTAIWETVSDVQYRIVYKNADVHSDDGSITYSFWGSTKLSTSPETVYTLDQLIEEYRDNITGLTDYQYFTFDEDTTRENNPNDITIASDGSTIVTLYYSRNIYTIRYVYARESIADGMIQLSNSTGNGNYYETGYNRIYWNYRVSELPTVDTLNGKLTLGTFNDSYGQYRLYYIALTSEYGANVESVWPSDVIGSVGEYSFGSWATEYGSIYRATYGDSYANVVGAYPTMSFEMIKDPNDSIAQTMYAWWGRSKDNISNHIYRIYYEVLPEEIPDMTLDGVGYTLNRTIQFQVAHNGNTRVDPFVYTGFTIVPNEKDGYEDSTSTGTLDGIWTTDFHYRRNVHAIRYYNYNDTYINPDTTIDTQNVMYGQLLTSFEPQDPPYPDGLPADKYEFMGWYDSDVYDHEFSWNSTMPDNDIVAYAYWKPKTYTINFYNNESEYLQQNQSVYVEQVDYGELIDTTSVESILKAPQFIVDGKVEEAQKVGWFYYDDSGELHAFDTTSMTVTGNINLFMEWTTTVPTYYTVHYLDKGTQEPVALDTIGYSFIGLTRTFKAKTYDELNDGYQEHYFPDRDSTSILMKSGINEVTFSYTYMDIVPYTVKYVDASTGEELLEDKVVFDNTKSIVTERYIPIEGYVPTSYYISLTLTTKDGLPDDEHNVVTFYYNEDNSNMIYHVKYLIEDDDGTYTYTDSNGNMLSFKEVNYINAVDTILSTKDIVLNDYEGYTAYSYQEIDYYSNTEVNVLEPILIPQETSSITIALDDDVDSKEIRIYYTKNSYDLKVVYEIDCENNDRIAEWNQTLTNDITNAIPDEATSFEYDEVTYYRRYYIISTNHKYNSIYTATATAIDGFTILGNQEKSIIVQVDDTTFSRNSITFTYSALESVMFYYDTVFPNEGHYNVLSINQECVEVGVSPNYPVTAPIEFENYRFVGWYRDSNCTEPVVDDGNGNVLTGDSNNVLRPFGSNMDVTYYAKYDYIRGNLTIHNTYANASDSSQAFEFTIQGIDTNNSWLEIKVCIVGENSITIQGLPVGAYTITQSNWSWRYAYTVDNETFIVNEYNPTDVTFTQNLIYTKWLDGNGYKDNDFGNTAS